MMLIALDCDGTVEVGNPPGPISLDMVRRLREFHLVFIVGNPALQLHIPMPTSGWVVGHDGLGGVAYPGSKSQALKDWKEKFPDASRYLVIDDNPDQYPYGWDGWEMIHPDEFVKRVRFLRDTTMTKDQYEQWLVDGKNPFAKKDP